MLVNILLYFTGVLRIPKYLLRTFYGMLVIFIFSPRMEQVRAEYDFDAQPGSGEMAIAAGEILTVVRKVFLNSHFLSTRQAS